MKTLLKISFFAVAILCSGTLTAQENAQTDSELSNNCDTVLFSGLKFTGPIFNRYTQDLSPLFDISKPLQNPLQLSLGFGQKDIANQPATLPFAEEMRYRRALENFELLYRNDSYQYRGGLNSERLREALENHPFPPRPPAMQRPNGNTTIIRPLPQR